METKSEIKVLMIDDDHDFFHIVKKLLAQSKGCIFDIQHAETFTSGMSALKCKSFDILIQDLSLSDAEGEDLFKKLKNQNPDIPVIVLTGTSHEEEGMAYIQKGAEDYILKDQIGAHYLCHSLMYAIERKRMSGKLKKAYQELQEKVKELEVLNEVMMGREEKIMKLEEENKALQEKIAA